MLHCVVWALDVVVELLVVPCSFCEIPARHINELSTSCNQIPRLKWLVTLPRQLHQSFWILKLTKETRGWYGSGGEIDCAGVKDQRDISEVISFALNQSALSWNLNGTQRHFGKDINKHLWYVYINLYDIYNWNVKRHLHTFVTTVFLCLSFSRVDHV